MGQAGIIGYIRGIDDLSAVGCGFQDQSGLAGALGVDGCGQTCRARTDNDDIFHGCASFILG